jgi:ankyrin repeat protein
LHYTTAEDDIVIAELLLDRGSDIESKDEDGCTVLHYVDVIDEGGCTPVAHAAAKGHQEIVWILLKEGADREIKD